MQRLIIIPHDKLVSIDGVVRAPLEFSIDPSVHAVQWYNGLGEVEYVSTSDGKPENTKITDISAFQSAIDAWHSWSPPEPAPAPASKVEVVTMRQARLALLDAGLLDNVESIVQQSPRAVQIEWEYATVMDRNSTLVVALSTQLGLTELQVDELFASAATL